MMNRINQPMTKKPQYPKRRVVRTFLRLLGRLLLPLLARLELEGLERFPRKGPLIVVGNHTGAFEVVLLTIYAPRIVEYLGSIDIPHEGYVGAIIYTYGFIPVFRGKVSRASMEAGLEVLQQDAVLGLFPEGGIWEPVIRKAQSGVAWLSYRGNAPVLPIGFSSTRGVLGQILRLKRPKLTMHVGEPIPAVKMVPGTPRKQQLQEAADRIVDSIWALVPEEEQIQEIPITDETFEFVVDVTDSDGKPVEIPEELKLKNGPALSKVLHRAVLFNNLLLNLQLPVAPLRVLHTQPSLEAIRTATQAILNYLETENPYYFTYRYGPVEGTAMGEGVEEFHNLVGWALQESYNLQAKPIRSYQRTDTGEQVSFDIPQEEEKW
jgi:1-acyl-sn-glycerol-3-phosphate acyltransferase